MQTLRDREGDALLALLGNLFDPRPGRDSRYRFPHVAADGAASPEQLRLRLEQALREPGEPLLLYVATHGEQGDSERENRVVLWGGFTLSTADFAGWIDELQPRRSLVMLNTACYSGGFMEMLFTDAEPSRGPAKVTRCGLFAATEDQVASGCDPDPRRRDGEGYGRYVLRALRGEDEHGQPLPREQLDYDGDGRISLLEAHTRARIATDSFDIPTTTSERWLRQQAKRTGKSAEVSLPEEQAVITALGARLGVADAQAATALLRQRDDSFERQSETWHELDDRANDAAEDLRIALLERWPVLDDPWHPDHASELAKNREEIAAFLAGSSLTAAYRASQAASDSAAELSDDRMVQVSAARRLVRAYETVELARHLKAKGGRAWKKYQELLACERALAR